MSFGCTALGEDTMELIRAEDNHIGRVVEIYNAAIPGRMATADLEPATVASKRDWYFAHSEKRPLYVAVSEVKIIGWASFENFYGRPAYHATAELSIYIDPVYQKRGVGSEILQKCIELAPALGVKTILGFVFEHNYPSLGLLRKYDFQQWGLLPEVAEMDGILYSLTIQGLKINVT
jgi:phosphinothricin acetyltransferase